MLERLLNLVSYLVKIQMNTFGATHLQPSLYLNCVCRWWVLISWFVRLLLHNLQACLVVLWGAAYLLKLEMSLDLRGLNLELFYALSLAWFLLSGQSAYHFTLNLEILSLLAGTVIYYWILVVAYCIVSPSHFSEPSNFLTLEIHLAAGYGRHIQIDWWILNRWLLGRFNLWYAGLVSMKCRCLSR